MYTLIIDPYINFKSWTGLFVRYAVLRTENIRSWASNIILQGPYIFIPFFAENLGPWYFSSAYLLMTVHFQSRAVYFTKTVYSILTSTVLFRTLHFSKWSLNCYFQGGEDDDMQRRVTIGGKMTIRRPPFKYAKLGFQDPRTGRSHLVRDFLI